jgi:hypothetical protein
MLWAPVNYDPGTFLLRLLKELCRSILGAREVAAADDSLRPLPRSSLVKGMAIVWLLIALLGIGVTLLILSLSNRKVEPDLQLGLAALLLFVFVTALLTVTLSSLVRERRFVRPYPLSFSSSGVPPWTRDYARRLKQQVEFSETYKSNSQLSFAAYGVGASGSRGNERARVPLNEIDAVKEIEALVQELAQEDFQVVIAIDELDKMKTDEDALAFLNQLKVLFPIENCSFIVSVSEHAWARFEHRGLPFRDAFDSSFDEVVLVPPLRPNESRDLLKRRNAEITDVQALFCHCLSGGLPRDLLRAARSLAETAETVMKTPPTSEPPSFSTVLNELLLSDLRDKVAAAEVRARDLDPPKLDLRELNCWIEIWPDESSLLDNLVQSRSDSLLEGTAVNDADRIPNADEVMVEQRLRSLREELAVYVGVLFTIREAFAPRGPLCKLVGQHDYAGDLIDDGFDGVARARLRISLDTIDGWRVLNSARSVLGLRPIESTARNVTRGGGQAS